MKRRILVWSALAVLVAGAAFAQAEIGAAVEPIEKHRLGEEESAAREALELARSRYGSDSAEAAAWMHRLARVLLLLGRYSDPEVLELARGSVAVRRELDPGGPALARSLRTLGEALANVDELARAVVVLRESVQLLDEALGPGDEKTVGAVLELALTQMKTGDMQAARLRLESHLAVCEEALGADHHLVGRIVGTFALVLMEQGELVAAEPHLERATGIMEKTGDPPAVAAALSLQANALGYRGQPAAAKELHARALEILRDYYGDDHPDVGTQHFNMGMVLRNLGEREQAARHLRRAMEVAERSHGPESRMVARATSALARITLDSGDWSRARELFERSLKAQETVLGPWHPWVALSKVDLGHALLELGDPHSARSLLETASRVLAEELSAEHRAVTSSRIALARALEATGEGERARELMRKSLSEYVAILGPDHGSVLSAKGTLAGMWSRAKRFDLARPLLEDALEGYERVYGPEHYSVVRPLRDLALLYDRIGKPSDARTLVERALKIQERIGGPDHPLMAALLAVRSAIDFASNREALGDALTAERIARDYFVNAAAVLSEREALLHEAVRVEGLSLALSVLAAEPGGPDRVARVWDNVIRSRALVLDELAARRASFLEADDPRVAAAHRNLVTARDTLSRLLLESPSGRGIARYRERIRQAVSREDQSERELAALSLSFGRRRARAQTGLDEVRRALPAGAALIAFTRFERLAPSRGREAEAGYLAFVLQSPSATPSVHLLGKAETVEALVDEWRSAVASPAFAVHGSNERAERAGRALREAVWDPLVPWLEPESLVFVVPDGGLHLVNFVTLPVGEGRYLVESGFRLHTLSAERDLAREAPATTQKASLLALGGPSFDGLSSDGPSFDGRVETKGRVSDTFRSAAPNCRALRELRFTPLPGARDEVESLAGLWRREKAGAVRVLTGTRASEVAFKTSAPDFDVVHMATHGFVYQEQCPLFTGVDAVGGDNPLVLAGLALAGANRKSDPGRQEDGILTAEEVASLDLSGVRWVVLSGCGTGLGTVRTGEGVLGLRRAFQVAGGRTLVLSLWQVPDASAAEWMQSLYRARLAGASTVEAMRQASLAALTARRRDGRSTHPFYWGAFVATGEWR